jgi:secreted PhoX family phosphatase
MPFLEESLAKKTSSLSFDPVKVPLPLSFENLGEGEQIQAYSSYEVVDEVVLPPGFTYDVLAVWGDRVGNSRFGYNNDYLSLVETSPNEGYLTINFEYISGKIWMDSFELVIGKALPFRAVQAALQENKGEVDAFSLPSDSPLKAQIQEIVSEGLTDLGLGVISVKRNAGGKWERTYSSADRRVTGLSGLKDGNYLQSTGPGVAVFRKAEKMGYEDNLGAKIIGTFQNCAGGTTPWGTVLSAEENFQDQVFEPVKADGSSFSPSFRPFLLTVSDIDGQANAFGLAGNKYGWMVEIDPSNPQDYGKKHTWLGRFRHEAVAFKAEVGKPLAVYSGCDRRSGHLYKFISQEPVNNLQDKNNSRLFESGMLYGAKFNADGTGKWIPLTISTPVDPVLPSQIVGKKGIVLLPNPNRLEGGLQEYSDDNLIQDYKDQFQTLGDLYTGNTTEKQGAILIDAHYAANAAGITCTARPEDTVISPEGTLYIAFTSGTPGSDGGPDKNIFRGPDGETPYEFGWIMVLKEDDNAPEALSFTWKMFATGGEPYAQGLGFANPDNLEFDQSGHLWMVTDMSTGVQNQPVKSRTVDGQPLSQTKLLGVFGNNSAWFLPTSGPQSGQAFPFAIGPMDTEMTGPWFSADQQTLFLAVQHPGEANGIRQNMAWEEREYLLKTTNGQEFWQKRRVPIGSNWPQGQPNQPPRPAVIAIRRLNQGAIT